MIVCNTLDFKPVRVCLFFYILFITDIFKKYMYILNKIINFKIFNKILNIIALKLRRMINYILIKQILS